MTAPERCPRCDELVDEHTVAGLRTCMADLHDHHLPFEAAPAGLEQEAQQMAGGVVVKAGVMDHVIGRYPVLVFEFSGVAGPFKPITLLLDADAMRHVARLVSRSAEAAIKAAGRG